MLQMMDGVLLRCQSRLWGYLDNLKKEEKGASDIVAIMVVIVVVIAVAGIFKEKLIEAVGTVFDKLTTFIGQD